MRTRNRLIVILLGACAIFPCVATAPQSIARLQYRTDSGFVDATDGTLYVLVGSRVRFQATAAKGTSFQSGNPRWGGTSGASGTGRAITVTFPTISSSTTDFKTVTATAGGTLTAKVVVFDFDAVGVPDDYFEGRSLRDFGVGETISLFFRTTPSITPAQAGGFRWVLAYGGGRLVDKGNGTGTYTVLNVPRVSTFALALRIRSGSSKDASRAVSFEAPGDDELPRAGRAEVPLDHPSQAPEERAIAARIEGASPEHLSGVIIESLARTKERWNDPQRYGALVYGVFAGLQSTRVPLSPDITDLEQRFALSVLEEPDRLSAALELELALCLRPRVLVAGSRKDELRKQLNVLFHAWDRLERETPSCFNSADWPVENFFPVGSKCAVMDPAKIPDLRLRDECLAAIAANNEKARKLNLQNEFGGRFWGPLLRRLESGIEAAIITGVATEAEIRERLGAFRDDDARKQILAGMASAREKRGSR